MHRRKTIQKNIARILTTVLLVGMLFALPAAAAEDYSPVSIYVDGIPAMTGYKVEESTYVSLRDFLTAIDPEADFSWDGETSTATAVLSMMTVSVTQDASYFEANGRCLPVEGGVRNIHDTLMLPIRELTELFGISLRWNADHGSINFSTDWEEEGLLPSGEDFYPQEDLDWLSRVIYAESGNQSLEGMIGVGNVVLNRVASDSFPDTVTDVIFQAGQFDVVSAGTVYNTPSAEAVVAAKLCLEGVNTAGDSLFFINPAVCDASWFYYNFQWVTTIEDHVFFA